MLLIYDLLAHFSPNSRGGYLLRTRNLAHLNPYNYILNFPIFVKHGNPMVHLHGEIKYIHDQLIVFGVNQQNLCGRSVDALVRFVRETEDSLGLIC